MAIVPGIAGDNGVVTATPNLCNGTVNSYSDRQCGIAKVFLCGPACSATQAPNSGQQMVTFSPAFSKTPLTHVLNTTLETGIDERSWTVLATTGIATWTAQPAAVTEIFGNVDHEWAMLWPADDNLTCSLVVNVVTPGVAGSVLRVQGSPDAVTWTNLQASPAGDVPINVAGIIVNNFASAGNGGLGVNLPSNGPFFRVVGQGGNGIVSPAFGNIYFECWWNTETVFVTFTGTTPSTLFVTAVILMPSSVFNQEVDVAWEACTVGC